MSYDQAMLSAIVGLGSVVAFMYLQVTVALREQKNECLKREQQCIDKCDALMVKVLRMEHFNEFRGRDPEATIPPGIKKVA